MFLHNFSTGENELRKLRLLTETSHFFVRMIDFIVKLHAPIVSTQKLKLSGRGRLYTLQHPHSHATRERRSSLGGANVEIKGRRT
jgi:hypothetical protein